MQKSGRVIFLIFLCFVFINCNGKEKQRPQKSTKLIIHCWAGYAKEHADYFIEHEMNKHNRKVELIISSTTSLESMINAANQEGAHLISPSNDLIVPLKNMGILKELDIKRFKNFNQLNPVIINTHCTEIEGKYYAVPFNFGAYLLAYNKDKVPSPTSYKILWDAKYKNRVTIPRYYDTINIYMTALMLGFPKEQLFDLSNYQLKIIERKLRELNVNQVSDFWLENLNPEKRDKFDIGMDWGIGVLQINEKYNGNWGVAIPDEGATAWIDTWAITKNVNDPEIEEIAYDFIDFMIDAEAQARMAKITSYGPVNPYATRYLTAEEKKKFYLTDPKFLNEFILWKPLDEKVLYKYKQLWKRTLR